MVDEIRSRNTVYVSIKNPEKAKVSITNTTVEVNPYDLYEGEYVFTSSSVDQTILTKKKALLENITILKMPTREVANEAGIGFYIGGTE